METIIKLSNAHFSLLVYFIGIVSGLIIILAYKANKASMPPKLPISLYTTNNHKPKKHRLVFECLFFAALAAFTVTCIIEISLAYGQYFH